MELGSSKQKHQTHVLPTVRSHHVLSIWFSTLADGIITPLKFSRHYRYSLICFSVNFGRIELIFLTLRRCSPKIHPTLRLLTVKLLEPRLSRPKRQVLLSHLLSLCSSSVLPRSFTRGDLFFYFSCCLVDFVSIPGNQLRVVFNL